MRRLLFLALLLFALLALGVPRVIGWLIETRAPALIADRALASESLRVTGTRVDAGWFSSLLRIDFSIGGRGPAVLVVDLAHGPWTGWPPGWLAGELSLRAPEGVLATGTARLSATGQLHADLWPASGAGRGHVSVAVAPDGRGEATFDALTIAPWVEALSGRVDGRATGDEADWAFSLSAATLASGNAAATDVQLEGEVVGGKGQLAVRLAGGAASARGTGAPWQRLGLRLALERLHAPTVEQLLTGLRRIADEPVSAEEQRRAAGRLVLTALPALLLNQPRIETFEAAGIAPYGAFEVDGRGALTAPPPAGFLTDFARLLEVLTFAGRAELAPAMLASLVEAKLRMETGLAVGAPALDRLRAEAIEGYLSGGWLERSENAYRISVSYEPQELRVNGTRRAWPARDRSLLPP